MRVIPRPQIVGVGLGDFAALAVVSGWNRRGMPSLAGRIMATGSHSRAPWYRPCPQRARAPRRRRRWAGAHETPRRQGRCAPAQTSANRTLDMLVKMFNLAEVWELRPPGKNPCRFVRRYQVQSQHERFLTPEELHRLGQALDAAPVERLASLHAAAAIRLLVLTGCRRNEILGLRWDDVDFEAGARVVPLTPPAAIPGCFREENEAHISATSMTPGIVSASTPTSMGCVFTIFDTHLPRAPWRWARAFQ